MIWWCCLDPIVFMVCCHRHNSTNSTRLADVIRTKWSSLSRPRGPGNSPHEVGMILIKQQSIMWLTSRSTRWNVNWWRREGAAPQLLRIRWSLWPFHIRDQPKIFKLITWLKLCEQLPLRYLYKRALGCQLIPLWNFFSGVKTQTPTFLENQRNEFFYYLRIRGSHMPV